MVKKLVSGTKANMIVPFEHNHLHIRDIDGKYVPTVINDYFRDDSSESGYVLCVNEDLYGYVFFRDGSVLSERAYSYPVRNRDCEMVDFTRLLMLSRVDLFINEISDVDTLDSLSGYNLFMHDLFLPDDIADRTMLKTRIERESLSGVVACRHGFITNMAFYDDGEFIKFSYYNTDSRSFAEETDEACFWEYMNMISFTDPVIIVKQTADTSGTSAVINPGRWLKERDIVLKNLMIYLDVYSVIMGTLRRHVTDDALHDALVSIISRLRMKYRPLYRELTVSGSNTVNWETILHDRRYVPTEYRFSEYYLYLEEILKKLLIVVLKFERNIDLDELLDNIGKYIALNDYKEPEIRRSVRRIEQTLRNCLHLEG